MELVRIFQIISLVPVAFFMVPLFYYVNRKSRLAGGIVIFMQCGAIVVQISGLIAFAYMVFIK